MTLTAMDPGLDHDPGPDRERYGRASSGNPPHYLVPGYQRVHDVLGLALPHLHVSPGDSGGLDCEPPPSRPGLAGNSVSEK